MKNVLKLLSLNAHGGAATELVSPHQNERRTRHSLLRPEPF
jgi:hypothetical protein